MKYTVKIPNPNKEDSYFEKKFETIDDVAEFLDIKKNTAYSLQTKRLKCNHLSKQKLKGIIIERHVKHPRNESKDVDVTKENVEQYKMNYQQELISKINES